VKLRWGFLLEKNHKEKSSGSVKQSVKIPNTTKERRKIGRKVLKYPA